MTRLAAERLLRKRLSGVQQKESPELPGQSPALRHRGYSQTNTQSRGRGKQAAKTKWGGERYLCNKRASHPKTRRKPHNSGETVAQRQLPNDLRMNKAHMGCRLTFRMNNWEQPAIG
jgi:hypothetical protein